MENNTETISSVYKSRNNLLKLLEYQGMKTNDYTNFSVNEVHAMFENKQLDMLVKNDTNNTNVYVKYHLGKTLRRENMNDYIDDLFNLEQILTKKDTLVIVAKLEPHDTLIKILNQIWEQDGIFIILFNIDRLQYNILEHNYVPKHIIINEDEIKTLKERYNVVSNDQLPRISRFDPVAMAIGMRPKQICKIIRPSKTSINTDYYRICI